MSPTRKPPNLVVSEALLQLAKTLVAEPSYWYFRVKNPSPKSADLLRRILGPEAEEAPGTRDLTWGFRTEQEAQKALREAGRAGIKGVGPDVFELEKGPITPNKSPQRIPYPHEVPKRQTPKLDRDMDDTTD